VEKWAGSQEQKDYCKHLISTQWYGWCNYDFIKSKCGEPQPIKKKTILAYRYVIVAAYALIPFDPKENVPLWKRFDSPLITSSSISIPDWQPDSPWPSIATGKNTCFGFAILVFYSDGTTCKSTDWNCSLVGLNSKSKN
jgi:hypothetical protein